MLLSKLLRSAGLFYRAEGDENISISSISSDSRSAEENSLFVCIRGRNHDGHSYAREAAAKGAVAILAEDGLKDLPSGVTVLYTPDTAAALARLWDAWYDHPGRDMKLIAVTGTNGKTTTCFMLDAVFTAAMCKCGIIGTVYCRTPKRLLEIESKTGMTTPEPDALYRVLDQMREDGAEYVFIEATSQALALGRLAPLVFEAAIFTNLTTDHLDFHGNIENYFLAKASLLEKCKLALINLDDGYADRYRAYARAIGCGADLLFYSANGRREADFRAEGVRLCGANGIGYTLSAKNTMRDIRSPIPGRFNVDNTLAAASLAVKMGIGGRNISEALAGFGGAPGRLKRIRTPSGYSASVYVDYAHTPDALENILKTARQFTPRGSRILLVFGCGGDRDRSKRPIMGRIASEYADVSIITSDNSRSELPEDIIGEILAGFDVSCRHAVIPSRADAIRYAVENAESGDVVLLCGKGHEKYEIGIDGKRDFDESRIVGESVRDRLIRDSFFAKTKEQNDNEG
ncbi:MAG: UDP-N-acetylmuramoyl-L-alanyl-D-glutamate--2,6-diaminopimelate ligase [Clostridia bacterium]|nr:UDP-N-acetylmuramoyl-L-alanyl-D-glutamate--2,6-diaminopimelate ligase [Clostridia bacterium]